MFNLLQHFFACFIRRHAYAAKEEMLQRFNSYKFKNTAIPKRNYNRYTNDRQEINAKRLLCRQKDGDSRLRSG